MDELPLSSLQALLAVIETRSFSRAAQRLGTRQSTVSTQIRKLEERVGTTLIERTTRSVRPTAAAQRLLPIARELLRLQRLALHRLDAAPLSGAASLGIDESVALSHAALELVRDFADTWPGVALRLDLAPATPLLRRFAAGALDLVLLHGEPFAAGHDGPAPSPAGSVLGRDRLGWYGTLPKAPPDGRWPLIGLPRDEALRARVDAALGAATPHRIVVEAASLGSAIDAARAGFGLIALPAPLAIRHLLEPAATRALPALGSWPVRLLQHESPAAAAAALRNALRQGWPARRAHARLAGPRAATDNAPAPTAPGTPARPTTARAKRNGPPA